MGEEKELDLMRRTTPDEELWLEVRWRETARTLKTIMIPFAYDLVLAASEAGEIRDADWRRFIEATGKELFRRRTSLQGSERGEMFAMAAGLLENTMPLKQRFIEAGAKLDDPGNHLLGRVLKQGLGAMRDLRLSDRPSRARKWARLDRVSRKLHHQRVADREERFEHGRCHADHFKALAKFIRANDLRLPVRPETIQNYFEEFCEECHRADELDPLADPQDITGRSLLAMPDYNPRLDALYNCLDELPEIVRKAVQVSFHVREERSMEAFCRDEGTNRFRVARLSAKTLGGLNDCIQGKLGEVAV